MRKSELTKYTEIGRNWANEAELLEAFKKVAGSYSKSRCEKRDILVGESLAAFRAGHPENIQALLSHPDAFGGSTYEYRRFVFDTVQKIMEESENKPADLSRALEKIPEGEKKKEVLNRLLSYCVGWKKPGTEAFVDLLLQSGADANAKIDDDAGYILFAAIRNDQPDSVIKLLYDNGARFEDALLVAQSNEYYRASTVKIMLCREKMEVKPDAPEAQAEKLLKLERRVEGLEDEVRGLKSLLEAALNLPKAEEMPQQQGIRLNRLNRTVSAP